MGLEEVDIFWAQIRHALEHIQKEGFHKWWKIFRPTLNPCPHSELMYIIKFTQPHLLCLLFWDPPSSNAGHHMLKPPAPSFAAVQCIVQPNASSICSETFPDSSPICEDSFSASVLGRERERRWPRARGSAVDGTATLASSEGFHRNWIYLFYRWRHK